MAPGEPVGPGTPATSTILLDGDGCSLESRPGSCAIVIFGASGDLTSRKLLPALARLYQVGVLPERFAIVGAARTELTTDLFCERMREALRAAGKLEGFPWDEFARHLAYVPLDYDSPESYRSLGALLNEIETGLGVDGIRGGNRIFYLAVPPSLYKTVAEGLGAAGLARAKEGRPLGRIVVEKPFGRDLATARDLDSSLHKSFSEEQIFRIDHYLAKETIQNILLFRFANSVFEPVWNRNYVEYVSILAAENLGVEHRAGYYEQSGVLRDMFQNHMMQLLALAAMDPPPKFEADRVRDEKTRVYHSLRPFDPESGFQDLVLGQYGAGSLGGREVPGYRQEPGVNPHSLVPTFAMLRLHLDNWRWQGVPFHLASGKRLARKVTRIVVQFKDVPHTIFRTALGEHVTANRLIMETSPEQAINMTFQVKRAGARLCLQTSSLRFDFQREAVGPPLDSYEKVLLDCMLGDHMLFLRQDSVELCWEFLTPILEMCEACGDLERHLRPYPSGSWGPEEANAVHLNYLRDLAV